MLPLPGRHTTALISIEETFDVPIDALFDVLTDHEGYGRFRGVKDCVLTQVGAPDRNGVGAVRRVDLEPLGRLHEEVVTFERPTLFEYRIIRSSPLPIDHRWGRIELFAEGNKTRALWQSEFTIPIPVLGRFLERAFVRRMSAGFRSLLKSSARLARAGRETTAKPSLESSSALEKLTGL